MNSGDRAGVIVVGIIAFVIVSFAVLYTANNIIVNKTFAEKGYVQKVISINNNDGKIWVKETPKNPNE